MGTHLGEAFSLFERLDAQSKGHIEVSHLIWVYQNLAPGFSASLQRLLKAAGKKDTDTLRFHEFCLLIGDEVPQLAEVPQVAAVKKAAYGSTRGNRKDRASLARRVQGRPRIDWSSADPSKWVFPELKFAGGYSYHQKPQINKVEATIFSGKEELKSRPDTIDGVFYQTNMTEWPEDQQKYECVKRTASGFQVKPQEDGHFTWVEAKYQALPADVMLEPDAFTDHMSHGGSKLAEPRLPGRGQGCDDVPGIKVVDVAHPRDVAQGGVGDCWLLCSMSSIAEFHGVIHSLFKKTPEIAKRPLDTFNQYTITLYDLSEPEWKPVDIVIDERLCSKPDNSGLLGAHPSVTGELWTCYLEKAIAAHCGGWDEIDGGTCTHAWRLMLGNRHVYTFKKKGDSFECFGTYNPNDNVWEQLDNSPHKGFRGLWPMVWPEVGGGGELGKMLNEDDFFDRLCAWEDANFIMACGSEAGSDKTDVEGIVQGHAYTILECHQNPGGADVDLIRLRNPWGQGEFTAGKWTDEGSGWKEHPEVKAALKPQDIDDGCFWMEKDEFFEFFPTVYLSALDMTTLQSNVEIKVGSVLEATEHYIAHQCNCCIHNRKVEGIATHIFAKFPHADSYTKRDSDPTLIDKPGTVQVFEPVLNLYSQFAPGKPTNLDGVPGSKWETQFVTAKDAGLLDPDAADSTDERLEWFKQCLNDLPNKLRGPTSIAFPSRIGCGLAGGTWEDYLAAIEEFAASNRRFHIVIYEFEKS